MPALVWTDKFSVKIAEIDAQHKKLVGMVNQLSQAMRVGQGREALGVILKDLAEYTQTHFAYEEELMARHAYPNAATHRIEHQDLIRQVTDLRKRFDAGSVGLSIPVLNFLQDWLTSHILDTDKSYSSHLNARGVR